MDKKSSDNKKIYQLISSVYFFEGLQEPNDNDSYDWYTYRDTSPYYNIQKQIVRILKPDI